MTDMHDVNLLDLLRNARKNGIDEVIGLIRSERVTHQDGRIDMDVDELVEMIQAIGNRYSEDL